MRKEEFFEEVGVKFERKNLQITKIKWKTKVWSLARKKKNLKMPTRAIGSIFFVYTTCKWCTNESFKGC